MSNGNDVEIHQGYRELLAQHDLLLSKYKAAQDLVSDIVGFDRDNGVHDVGTMADRIDALLADQMPAPQQTNWPDQCPITRRDFFMEIDGVPTYGGPYDSYTIPEMLGTPDQPLHERELFVHRYDHDLGGWRDDECIPMRIIREDVLWELEEKAEKASLNAFSLESWQPIETAPRDGRKALVYRPLAENSGDERIAVKRLIGGRSNGCWDKTVPPGETPFNPTDGACHVTHWMPLPDDPVTTIAPEQSGGRTITEGQEHELTAVLESIAKGLCDDPARDASFLLKRITTDWWDQQQGGEPCATASPSSNEG